MKRKIVGVTVGTSLNPEQIRKKIKPVTSVNGIKADESGNVKINIPDSGGSLDVSIDGETLVIAENSTATIEDETLIL